MLFGKVKKHDVDIPGPVAPGGSGGGGGSVAPPAHGADAGGAGGDISIRDAIRWICDNLVKERAHLFVAGDSVCVRACAPVCAGDSVSMRVRASAGCVPPVLCRRRPGILVLLNDVDWELEGRLDALLHEGDVVTFISTLHGG